MAPQLRVFVAILVLSLGCKQSLEEPVSHKPVRLRMEVGRVPWNESRSFEIQAAVIRHVNEWTTSCDCLAVDTSSISHPEQVRLRLNQAKPDEEVAGHFCFFVEGLGQDGKVKCHISIEFEQVEP